MTLTLEVGKSYLSADGRCSGPMYRENGLFRASNIKDRYGRDQFYSLDGTLFASKIGEENDRLIAEWSEPALPPLFKDLPPEEQHAQLAAMLRGELEIYLPFGSDSPRWWVRAEILHPDYRHRITTRLPSVDWSHVHDSINVITVSRGCESGACWASTPTCEEGRWSGGVYMGNTRALASFDPGTCPAEQAIVVRPGYVEGK